MRVIPESRRQLRHLVPGEEQRRPLRPGGQVGAAVVALLLHGHVDDVPRPERRQRRQGAGGAEVVVEALVGGHTHTKKRKKRG